MASQSVLPAGVGGSTAGTMFERPPVLKSETAVFRCRKPGWTTLQGDQTSRWPIHSFRIFDADHEIFSASTVPDFGPWAASHR
ncbi:MAG: hypothetical protein BJ554DRAFT_5104, partial [Olpidium bornovanus]